jgi:hypothetical protein
MSLVDKNEDQVKRMVEEGELLWAFDVALDPARSKARELRILPACVADYLRGVPCSLEWPDVIELLLPHNEPVIRTPEITRALNVSQHHVAHLAGRKVITQCSPGRRGARGSASFLTASFVAFLKERRFP